MKKIIKKIKGFLKSSSQSKCDGDVICFEWSENENAQYEKFAVEHFEECSTSTPWLCFKFANGKWYKKMICPVCGEEQIIKK
ncbi:MAG: hypothetical protein J6J23_00755 [Clostridia bacterium]|nr:hypothetical protein [Clostridia bacterium]